MCVCVCVRACVRVCKINLRRIWGSLGRYKDYLEVQGRARKRVLRESWRFHESWKCHPGAKFVCVQWLSAKAAMAMHHRRQSKASWSLVSRDWRYGWFMFSKSWHKPWRAVCSVHWSQMARTAAFTTPNIMHARADGGGWQIVDLKNKNNKKLSRWICLYEDRPPYHMF